MITTGSLGHANIMHRSHPKQFSHEVMGCDSLRITVDEVGIQDWRYPFIDFIQYGILPDDLKEKVSIRRRAPRFHYDPQTKTLYRKSYDGVLLRTDQEAEKVFIGLFSR